MAALADTNLPPEATLNALQEAARAGNIEPSIHLGLRRGENRLLGGWGRTPKLADCAQDFAPIA